MMNLKIYNSKQRRLGKLIAFLQKQHISGHETSSQPISVPLNNASTTLTSTISHMQMCDHAILNAAEGVSQT